MTIEFIVSISKIQIIYKKLINNYIKIYNVIIN